MMSAAAVVPTESGRPEAVDGRSARREKNRLAVLDAMLELFADGDLHPTPEAVAKRAGLSQRSVYRYFEDLDELTRAAIARSREFTHPLLRISAIGQGSLDERISRFVEGRVRAHSGMSAAHQATRLRSVTDEILRDELEYLRRGLREQVEKHFAAELETFDARKRRSVVAAIDVLCELESLDHLRIHRGLSSSETQTMLVDSLHALLAS